MKTHNYSKLLFIVGLSTFIFSLNAQETSLMSYNVGSSIWATTKDSVVGRVTWNDPDVFCAIEAVNSKRIFLESALTNYRLVESFGASPELTESHIFIKNGMFSVVDSGFVQAETFVGYTGVARYVNWARLQNNVSGSEFLVYASHFIAPFGASADSAEIAQFRHADAMVQLLNTHVPLGIPMITVGDFNANSTTDVMQFLIDQTPVSIYGNVITNPIELDDSWDIANPGITKPATTGAGSSAIDWILTTPNTNVLTAIIDDQGVNGSGEYPSDHLPLQITFDLVFIFSVNEIDQASTIQIYPNPTSSNLSFETEGEIEEVTIYNSMGEIVQTEFTSTFSVFELPEGIYLIDVRTNLGQSRARFMRVSE